MNDLVSEYQQYQDATAEGKLANSFVLRSNENLFFLLSFL